MSLKLITPPSAPAVSLAEAKLHLRVDGNDDDALITAMIDAATQMAEQATGRALMPQTWQLSQDEFPGAFELTRIPVQSVASIVYTDASGVDQPLDPANYTLDNASDFGSAKIVPAYAKTWPASRTKVNAVRVQYVAGYADAASVPESIKAWIKLMVGAMYENREFEVVGGIAHPLGFADRLLDRYKVRS